MNGFQYKPRGPAPCCVILKRTSQAPIDASGVALIRTLSQIRPGRTAISVLGHGLPSPTELGYFNSYECMAFIPQIITWRWLLFPTGELSFPTWAGTITEITAGLTPNTVIQIRPFNTVTNQSGSPLLIGRFSSCVT